MRRAVFLLALLVLITAGTPVLADGMFYWTESIPKEVPYQRAMLLFDGEQETLIVQSKYRTSRATGEAFGWVVPVPSVPELASMDLGLADWLFDRADRASSPDVTRLSDPFSPGLLIVVCGGAVLMLFASLLSLFVRRMPFVPQHRAALVAGAVLMLLPVLTPRALDWIQHLPEWAWYGVLFLGPILALLVLLLCMLSPFVSPLHWLKGSRGILVASALLSLALPFSVMFSRTAGMPGISESAGTAVEVMKSERVGIYDAQVVKAARAEDLIDWFDESGFRFDDTDLQVIEDYLERGWVFVTARVDPGAQEPADEALVAPLIMGFQSEAPVYPLALTSTAGRKTEILLYLFSQHKWTSQGRLRLWYAGGPRAVLDELRERVEEWGTMYATDEEETSLPLDPPGFFGDNDLALPYLCKFKGTLSPEQMAQDLVFTRAGNDKPYRRHITIW